ncbi:TetR family transcriptional regulator [Microbacterium tumbae]
MTRWPADTQERLKRTAIDLFSSRGFDAVTVAEIAEAAGVTERTFFRYFGDKREVLFTDQNAYNALFLDALADADATSPLALVEAALRGGGTFFPEQRRPMSRARQKVIDSSTALLERDSLKRGALVDALTTALVTRGVPPVAASLAAQSGSAVFHVAFTAWVSEGEDRSFIELLDDALAALRSLLA